MAPMCLVDVELSESMIKDKVLYFPTELLWTLPPPVDNDQKRPVYFPVRCGDSGERTFCCRKRSSGPLRPVIQRGWSDVINAFGLRAGDSFQLYHEAANDHERARYWIEVSRMEVCHEDEMGITRERRRIIA